ncbi:MAG: DUF169 domain-containing protein [Tannerella sp.]|jgi:uncharacterized protein (DUF169 family)|nr:DUF169 domain-containing protein [Tannerella sp.]
MTPLKTDLSIWKKLELNAPPVGVKFLLEETPKEPIQKLDETKYTLCEMIKVAQKSPDKFYINADNESCVGSFILGMNELPPAALSGQMGKAMGIFQDERCNARLYHDLPRMKSGTVGSVVFSPLDQIDFDPDLLFVLAEPSVGEIILRAMTYSTGERYHSCFQPVMACAFLFAYPLLSGKVNFITTGMSYGMKTFEVFRPGQILMAIPYQWIPTITRNLGEIDWVLEPYKMGRDRYAEYFAKIVEQTEG